jgi:cytosine/adenosine deaminase-related metal-dependent hydrolase
LPPVEMMRREGLTLCVGTDSLSSNDELDMVRELYCLQEHFPEVPLEELLEWACRNGARFLGKEDVLGSFAPGSKAGVVLIDHLQDGRLTAESHSRRL